MYAELGTILKKCIIDTITITHFFFIIDTIVYYNYFKKNNSRYNYKYRIVLVDTF